MAKVQITLPAMGEGIIEAEITRWLVKEGQAVEADEPVVEVATDKVDSEIPAPLSGIINKILFSEGEVPKIGQVIAILSTDSAGYEIQEKEESSMDASAHPDGSVSESTGQVEIQTGMHDVTSQSRYLADVAFLSPVVRKMAREHNLNPQEVSAIKGSGVGGRITRRDMENYLNSSPVADESAGPPPTEGENVGPPPTEAGIAGSQSAEGGIVGSQPAESGGADYTHTVMDRMRQKIADNMVYSKKTAPHVTSFVESDVTIMMDWRNRVKNDFKTKYGQNLTVTTLVIEAVIKALKEFPDINISVDGHTIIHKKELNIGMATALPDGNLIVPVIREADKLNLAGLAGVVNDLAERARNNSLKPEEVAGGTFTVTNLGNFGNLTGTPIINQPEVAILAVGAIRPLPAVVETPEGDSIGIRQMMMLSLAYDHRVVDGALGGSFLRSIGDHLQHFDNNRII